VNCSTEPENELNLAIHDGYYSKTSNSVAEVTYSIEFEYSVTGDSCNVGGYGISWGDGKNGFVDWYIMQKLEPGRIYTIIDTFKLEEDISKSPIISMQGYLLGVTEADSRLQADYQLKNK
jgi:hypothetical protein